MPLQFGDLPASHPGRPEVWVKEAAELRARPGDWAVLITMQNHGSARSYATRIRKGTVKAFRPVGAFEATSRGGDVWVRYVGEEGQS